VNDVWHAAWVAALDELELSLDDAERLLEGNHPGEAEIPLWKPPTIPAPIPDELLPRAEELVARQRDVIGATLRAMAAARQQLELVDKVAGLHGARTADRPVYVDLSA
jgi:hypothetical protein